MMGLRTRLLSWMVGMGAALAIILPSAGAIAAERVVWRYQILRGSLSVADLTQLAETGEVSPELRTYLRRVGKDPQEIRDLLNQGITVNPRLFSQMLTSSVGGIVLDQLGRAIHTPSNVANREAMRGALLLAVGEDRRVTVIEIIQNYPTEEVHVNGDRLAAAYRQLASLQNRLADLLQGGRLF